MGRAALCCQISPPLQKRVGGRLTGLDIWKCLIAFQVLFHKTKNFLYVSALIIENSKQALFSKTKMQMPWWCGKLLGHHQLALLYMCKCLSITSLWGRKKKWELLASFHHISAPVVCCVLIELEVTQYRCPRATTRRVCAGSVSCQRRRAEEIQVCCSFR